MPTTYSLVSRTWLPHPLSINVTVFLLGSGTSISLQRLALSYSGQLSRERGNIIKDLTTVCSAVARQRIAVLQLNIYSPTLAEKLCTVNNYHIASVRTSLMQARQSPFLPPLRGGKEPSHTFQLCAPELVQLQHPGDTCPIPDITTNACIRVRHSLWC